MRKWVRERLMRRRKKSPETEQTGRIGQERPSSGAAPLVPSYDFNLPPAKMAAAERAGKIELETQPESLAAPPSSQAIPRPPEKQPRAPRGVVVLDRKSTRLNSSHTQKSRMPSSA